MRLVRRSRYIVGSVFLVLGGLVVGTSALWIASSSAEPRAGWIAEAELRRAGQVLAEVERAPTDFGQLVSKLERPWTETLLLLGRRAHRQGFTVMSQAADAFAPLAVDGISLGFGVKHRNLAPGAMRPLPGSCSFSFSTYDGQILRATVTCFLDHPDRGDPWTEAHVRTMLDHGAEIAIEPTSATIIAAVGNTIVEERAARRRATSLGAFETAAVPASLEDSYAALTARPYPIYGRYCSKNNLSAGARSADKILEAGRPDLLLNAARGPSPSGRVFAAVALRASNPAGLRSNIDEIVTALERDGGTVPTCGAGERLVPASNLLKTDLENREYAERLHATE